MKKLQDMADPVTGRKRESSYRLPRQLKRGDLVIINELNKEGTVLSDPDSSGNVMVQAGILKTRVPVGGLRLIEDQEKKKITYNGGGKSGVSYRDVKASARRDAKTEVDLRGMTTDEALLELDQYLDGARPRRAEHCDHHPRQGDPAPCGLRCTSTCASTRRFAPSAWGCMGKGNPASLSRN